MIVDFVTAITFDSVVVNNWSHLGGGTIRGAKNTVAYISSDDISDTTYGAAIANSTEIASTVLTEHPATDTQDDQDLLKSSVNSVAPVISGTFTVGEVLSCTTGTWGAPAPTSYLYQWTKDGVNITSATNSTYTLVTGDTDAAIICKVSAINPYGTSDYVNSNALGVVVYTAKTVIFEIASNFGGDNYVGIRSVEFYNSAGALMTPAYTAYSTSNYGTTPPIHAFNTTLSKIGAYASLAWMSNGQVNQRLICVFDTEQEFAGITINNHHNSGGELLRGANAVKIYVSTDTITSTVFEEALTNDTLIFDSNFAQHVATNTVDDQELTLAEITVYTSVVSLFEESYDLTSTGS